MTERDYSRTDLSEERKAAIAACDSDALASLLRDAQDVYELAEVLRNGLDEKLLEAAIPRSEESRGNSWEPMLSDSEAWGLTHLAKDVGLALDLTRECMEQTADAAYTLNLTLGDLPGRLVSEALRRERAAAELTQGLIKTRPC